MSSFLTVDLGNSRCKLRVFEVGTPGHRDVLAADPSVLASRPSLLASHGSPLASHESLLASHERLLASQRSLLASQRSLLASLDEPSAPGIASAVETWLARSPRFERAGMSSVADPAVEQELARVLGERLVSALDAGLSIECREPARVGADRLYAARGARDLVGASAIVLDAGTALTVDAVRVDPAGASRFLGGAIAPGPTLVADALARHTARLPRIVPAPGAHALGRDTEEALRAGTVVGFRGAARELVLSVAREAGLDDAPLVVTGGAREFLRDEGGRSLFGTRVVFVEPDLVHLGLLAALVESGGREPVP